MLHNIARSNCFNITIFLVSNTQKVCMGTTYYLLGRKLHQRTTSTAKIVISANGETLFGRRSCPSFGTSKMEDTSKTTLFLHCFKTSRIRHEFTDHVADSIWSTSFEGSWSRSCMSTQQLIGSWRKSKDYTM